VGTYVARRLLQGLIVLLGISFVTFGAIFLTGDPSSLMVNETWTKQQIEDFRHEMGFDRPWLVQYGDFIADALRGDFGTSLRVNQPAFTLVLERMPATLELTIASIVYSTLIALPVGIISAVRRNTFLDFLVRGVTILAQAVPIFWLGILLIMFFGVKLRWLPVSGRGDWRNLIMPALSLGTFALARNTRLIRSCLLEVLGQNYIITARAKGLHERSILYSHALRNALIPTITLIGLQFSTLLGGAIITETVFSWPGVGRLAVNSIYNKDFPVVQASVTILASIFVVVNLAVDIIYTYLDPKIRLQ
jgi:peptide/nickel transport system permease protein